MQGPLRTFPLTHEKVPRNSCVQILAVDGKKPLHRSSEIPPRIGQLSRLTTHSLLLRFQNLEEIL